MLECSVKDPKYVDLVEATLGVTDFTAFTVQTNNDMRKIHQQLYNVLNLGRITIRTVLGTLENFPPPVSREDLRRYGLEGWVLDHVAGPEAVLAMLCESSNLHRTGIAIQDTPPQQFEMLKDSPIPRWVTRSSFYRINRRWEYGAGAFSINVSEVRSARFWTDQPVDTTAKRDLQKRIDTWTEEARTIRAEIEDIGRQLLGLKNKVAELEDEKVPREAPFTYILQKQYSDVCSVLYKKKRRRSKKRFMLSRQYQSELVKSSSISSSSC